MIYSELKDTLSEVLGITVKEKPLQSSDGRISGNNIAVREDIESDTEKKCILYEELGHLFTTVGDITRCCSIDALKQERRARKWAYETYMPIESLYAAQEAGCDELWDTAEFLGVTEEFLRDALSCYEAMYGPRSDVGLFTISFNPLNIERR